MPRENFQIKICGITSIEDAKAAIEAGADAIGLNFCSLSSRQVEADIVPSIANEINNHHKRCLSVGVFVNSDPAEVQQASAKFNLDLIQLHGDEGVELTDVLDPNRIIRAIRICENRFDLAFAEIGIWHSAGVRQFLLDYGSSRSFGGTGSVLDWLATKSLIEQCRKAISDTRFVLAGGLTPENVAQAIGETGTDGVDTASGVEATPRRKDAARMRDFVRTAVEAFSLQGDQRQ